ncbi:MAG TPA: cupin domain-containing protein [Candidatus Binatia bacterium]|nr:cupin domain-containing protein [Candidatus Binatia bacterium]
MANNSAVPNITSTYVVLDTEGKAMPIAVTETFWQDLASKSGDFAGRRLVACFNFDKDWETWEMHPHGDEVVCLLTGDIAVVLEEDGARRTVRLNQPQAFVIVPRSTWHTAKVRSPSTVLFVTPDQGTETRPVEEEHAQRGVQPDA